MIEQQIADKLVSIISGLDNGSGSSLFNSVDFDRVRLSMEDFRDHEIPAAQFWDVGQIIEHERGRAKVRWAISLEIILKQLQSNTASQKELWDLRRICQLALWEKPNLDIQGVIHLVYTGNATDLHLLEPYYIARLDFEVLYYDSLTGTC